MKNFETLRKNLVSFDIERTIGFLKDCNDDEKNSMIHNIKRNQIFNIQYPNDFEQKLKFLKKINKRSDEFNASSELKLYFEFLESIFSAIEIFYTQFKEFYNELKKNNQTNFFLFYIFTFYISFMEKIISYVNEKKEMHLNQIFDSTSTITMPSKDGLLINIDNQIEFICDFIKINIMFYQYESKEKSIQIIPLGETTETLKNNIEQILKKNMNEILYSFNSWKNGIELIDLINLFDWKISKKNKAEITSYFIKPKKNRMNEYINKEFGLFIYSNLKFTSKFIMNLKNIHKFIEKEDIQSLVNIEFSYIVNTFENEYYVDSNIFNEKYNNYKLEHYVKFYLLYRVYFFYFFDNEKKINSIYIVDHEFFLTLFSENIQLFNNEINSKELKDFFENCLDFYINNGNDIFNYPFFKYSCLEYAIPNSIEYANTTRIFMERFLKIIPANKLSKKGPMLEKSLLFDSKKLQDRGIKIIKNIALKIGKKEFGEIDILLYDGENIIIAELKNQSLFNCHKERYNRKKDLRKKAVIQINKAKEFLINHENTMSIQLGINLKNVKDIIPIVITSLDELNNLIIDNTLIISSFFIKTYFEYNHFSLKEMDLKDTTVIKEKYFNEKKINLKEFIKFIKLNNSIKILNFFKDRKITSVSVFENKNTKFERTILS